MIITIDTDNCTTPVCTDQPPASQPFVKEFSKDDWTTYGDTFLKISAEEHGKGLNPSVWILRHDDTQTQMRYLNLSSDDVKRTVLDLNGNIGIFAASEFDTFKCRVVIR